MGCTGFYNTNLGQTFYVCGRILDKYNELGGPGGFLGPPKTNEITNPGNTGKRTTFQNDASIYWSPATDAHEIGGAIGKKWGDLGYENGLGYPTSDELTNPDGRGKHNSFYNDASIYWSPETDAHEIGGAIGAKWGEMHWESGSLGYPTTDELGTPNGQGRFNHFENGSIYWTTGTGAHSLTREMMAIWGAFEYENGEMGFPAGDTETSPSPAVTGSPDTLNPQVAMAAQQQVFQHAVAAISSDGTASVRGR